MNRPGERPRPSLSAPARALQADRCKVAQAGLRPGFAWGLQEIHKLPKDRSFYPQFE